MMPPSCPCALARRFLTESISVSGMSMFAPCFKVQVPVP
jgi:hypothetical protein